VLPLNNLGGAPAQECFADGMTEALITDLAQIAALRAISQTSEVPESAAAGRVAGVGLSSSAVN
jgi:TolB-like protein